MPSERVQRRIDRLLDAAEQAMDQRDWARAETLARDVLNLDPDNADALTFLSALERGRTSVEPAPTGPASRATQEPTGKAAPTVPSSFVNGRYAVEKFLGEGGKKKVYLARDTTLRRQVAFALIKTEGLDDVGRERIVREGQAMGTLGAHPHIVTVFDLGEEQGAPYMVTELMGGGDVEGVIEKAPEHKLPLEQALRIADEVCQGLEFAHGKGIVHRDLKPGNVWLTEQGIAKIGDFGLAVAVNRSRLTQEGMMVGTVSYMPPEQATGREVTPRADLYSLGAMLYEMVTGRPPFVGDDSVAIVGQHLNTPPVAPTWHRPDCSPGLEALILRLLEKDPARRPASAAEVRQALQALAADNRQQAAVGEAGPDAGSLVPAASGDPIYRRAFVGRETELRQLHAAFDAALSGQGAFVTVVGEPGIGKTAVCEQLSTYAALRGGGVLVGHCYEEGSLSLPYLPFVEVMRSYVLARDPDGLRQDLGSGAADVARIVSEIRDRVAVELRGAGDPEEDRWRLLQAVAGFLRNASRVQPLVIVLEDLHDADRGTLDLLVHLAHGLGGSRLLLVGTYRDVEVDRAHPLSGALAELRRGGNFLRIPLRGLTADEVQRMMAGVSQQEIPWPFAELVHRQTEGNPLFVQEMLRYLVEEGLVERREGALRRVGEDTLAGRIPEGLRDVIGKRLSRLSESTNQVLSVASVIGREFRLDVLQRVAGISDEALEGALAEAMAVAVVEERAGVGAAVSYRFTHAFFRQTLYEETIAPRRIRLHQQVARALEAVYGRRLQEHAAELAEHYAYSTDPQDLSKAVAYGELAAQRAMSVYAYGEAARHLEQALKVQDVLNPDDKAKRCDLLLALGEALLAGVMPVRVLEEIAPEALSLAKQLGDRPRASIACQQALEAITTQQGFGSQGRPSRQSWVEEANRYAAPGSVERVYADIVMAGGLYFSDRSADGWALIQQARALAEQLQDPRAQAWVAIRMTNGTWLPEHQQERRQAANESVALLSTGAPLRSIDAVALLLGAFDVFVAWGDRAEAEDARARSAELAERTHHVDAIVQADGMRIILLGIDGELEAASSAAEELRASSERLGVPGLGLSLARHGWLWPLLYLGRASYAFENEVPLDKRLLAQGGSLSRAATPALCLAYAGRIDELQPYLDQLRSRLVTAEPPLRLPVTTVVHSLAAAVAVGDRELAKALSDDVRAIAHLISEVFPTSIARHLGDAAALLGEREQAQAYYEQALEVCNRLHFRPEIALTHLGIAELLLEDDHQAQLAGALEHLDFAIAEFRDMKMQPALERALRHKEVLKA
jgi:tetratricopeptide (TPR) repeat protein